MGMTDSGASCTYIPENYFDSFIFELGRYFPEGYKGTDALEYYLPCSL
jgi:hypothetical protein